jgi:hypothetical protein
MRGFEHLARSTEENAFLLAPFYTYLFNRTGSALPCLLLHGSFTAAQEHLTLMAGEVHGVTDAAIGIAYLVGGLVLLMLTRGRLGKGAPAPDA